MKKNWKTECKKNYHLLSDLEQLNRCPWSPSDWALPEFRGASIHLDQIIRDWRRGYLSDCKRVVDLRGQIFRMNSKSTYTRALNLMRAIKRSSDRRSCTIIRQKLSKLGQIPVNFEFRFFRIYVFIWGLASIEETPSGKTFNLKHFQVI